MKLKLVIRNLTIAVIFGIFTGCSEDIQIEREMNGIFIAPASEDITDEFPIFFIDYPSTRNIAIALYEEAEENIEVTIAQNNKLVAQFNKNNSTNYSIIPPEKVSFSTKNPVITAGSKASDTLLITINGDGLASEDLFLLPIEITQVSGGNIELNSAMNVKYFMVQGGDLPNIAVGKPTSQSSITAGGISSRAVDGNTNGFWGGGSVTHTSGMGEDWWQVDLESVSPIIQEIKIYNRQDCCSERLTDFYVFVSDEPFVSDSLVDILAQDQVFSYYHEGVAEYMTTVPVNRTGRYIRVQQTGLTPLALAEVEVLGILE